MVLYRGYDFIECWRRRSNPLPTLILILWTPRSLYFNFTRVWNISQYDLPNVWLAQCQDLRQRQHRTEQKLKFQISLGIEPGQQGWKSGTLPATPRRWMVKFTPTINSLRKAVFSNVGGQHDNRRWNYCN